MRTWATSGRVKIDRAYEHIRHLEAEISAFRERRPYHVVCETYPQYRRDEIAKYVIRAKESIPLSWSATAADAIHNLHVALDYLWQRATRGLNTTRKTYFPALRDPEAAKARFKGKEHSRLKTAVDILKSVKAFEVGNPFYTIRCFDDADKHDTLVLVACRLKGFSVDMVETAPVAAPRLSRYRPHFPSSDSEFEIIEDGAVLYNAVAQSPTTMHVDHELSFEIAFGDGEVLKREPVLPSLQNLATAVDSLAAAFAEQGVLA